MAVASGEALYIQIDRVLQADISSDSLCCSIFKVPNHLREINEKAYEPQVISIGPYHRGKNHLKAMEVHKKHYLKMLLKRREENSVEKYVKALQGLKEKALGCYSEPPDHKGGEDQFVEMMLFDGCFIVELVRKSAMKELREKNDHLLTHFMLRTVMRDLLLIENQLPFFILKELFDMTKMSNEADQNFMHMAINCFSIMMPGPCIGKIESHPGIKHLLGLLHDSLVLSQSSEEVRLSCCESPEEVQSLSILSGEVMFSQPESSELVEFPATYPVLMNPQHSDNRQESASLVSRGPPRRLCSADFVVGRFKRISTMKKSRRAVSFSADSVAGSFKRILKIKKSKGESLHASGHRMNEEKNCKWQTISSASELHKAGIKFQKIEGRLFDINFEKGVMSMPTLKIVDDTESILRNLVAYEQCYRDISSRRFTEYIKFMDCLINTGQDVKLLCHHGVIENRLGDNEVVADIFNRICDSVLIVEEDFFYAETFIKVNRHCKRKWTQWKANLRQNYFNTPWALISFLAAVFLLLLTVMQSVYAAVGYHHQNSRQ